MQGEFVEDRDHGAVYVYLSQLKVWAKNTDYRMGKYTNHRH